MSVIDTLITDRTSSDVDRVKQLAEKISTGTATQAEITEYLTDLKGAYNASDLNRVGTACAYLHQRLTDIGYYVPNYITPKIDWAVTDVPTATQMTEYITNVAALKAVWSAAQEIPSTMNLLGYEDANNIEKLLIEVDDQITRISAIFIRADAWNAYCGTGLYIAN